ncbi:MAG: MraZ family transcriptional regulator [Atopobiaceae bacterium]|jgi:MraZ protein|nr:MraZ family transcriptional regulator [Atopobiaceae bacterium]MCH4120426.1 MraZ family transcriptional regulator [Atopobiaceae bacterium]MCI1318363.1 MraZ family transcriptional regulator [Atopobiaceae bacterium]MCI1388264.1 MraZ family transcriptional regulator [Atopobiaceae bacterium]MCI1431486.1 MraZ family transcriptional regulator [Atopobiaceae bacterium]
MYLTGTYKMSMDAKARLTLPAAHRKELGKTVCLAPIDGRVCGFTPQGYEEYVNGLFEYGDRHFDPRSRDDVRLKGYLTSLAETVDIDSAGRVALGKLDAAHSGRLESLGLSGDVTVVGSGDHFEIWNSEKWAAEQKAVEEDLASLLYHD